MVKKNSSRTLEINLHNNLSSIEDSIVVHKHMSIRYLSNPDNEIKGFSFNNFLLSKNLSEKYSRATETSLYKNQQKCEFPRALSPICFHNILRKTWKFLNIFLGNISKITSTSKFYPNNPDLEPVWISN